MHGTMTAKVERRYPEYEVEEAIAVFTRATDPHEVEEIADYLGEEGDARAIRPLLSRLGDPQVQGDADVEDSVCRALMALGVMCACGEHVFALRPRPALDEEVVATIRELSTEIPWQYFGTRRI